MVETLRLPVSRPIVTVELTLRSAIAQRLSNRSLKEALLALRELEGRLKARLPETEAARLEGEADTLIETLIRDFAHTQEQLKPKQPLAEFLCFRYTSPKTLAFDARSPRALRLIRLLETLDGLVERLDRAWLAGELTTRVRATRTLEWSRRLLKLQRRLRGLARSGRRLIDAGHSSVVVLTESQSIPDEGDLGGPMGVCRHDQDAG